MFIYMYVCIYQLFISLMILAYKLSWNMYFTI